MQVELIKIKNAVCRLNFYAVIKVVIKSYNGLTFNIIITHHQELTSIV